jgi:hypothetical protein
MFRGIPGRNDVWFPAAEYDPLMAGSIDGTDVVPHDRAIVRAQYSFCMWFIPQ